MKVTLNRSVFIALHDRILVKFREDNLNHNSKSYQLYGYNDFNKEGKDSIRNSIIEKYAAAGKKDYLLDLFGKNKEGEIIYNGKYLRDAMYVRLGNKFEISINKYYLETWLFYLGFEKLDDFIADLEKSGKINLKEKLKQNHLLHPQPEFSNSFLCFYFSPTKKKVESIPLEINGNNATIKAAPSGRSYSGKVYNENENRRIKLDSDDGRLAKGYLNIIFRNSDKDWMNTNFSVGYFASFSESETTAGAVIVEKVLCLEFPEDEIDLKEIEQNIHLDKKRKIIAKAISEGENFSTCYQVEDFCSFIDSEFIMTISKKLIEAKNKITKGYVVEELKKIKKEFIKLYLRNKHVATSHSDITQYEEFARHINDKFEGWHSNHEILKEISGNYICYVPLIKRNYTTGKMEKKIELALFNFLKDGRMTCLGVGSSFFEGTIQIKNQRIAIVDMKKSDKISRYQMLFEIPIGYRQMGERPHFKGVFCGMDRDGQIVSNKVYLKQVSLQDYLDLKNKPQFFYNNDENHRKKIKEIQEECVDFSNFFSLKAKDNYAGGSNIFFENLISYPDNRGALSDFEGVYEIYRSSNSTTTCKVKKFPIEIKSDGSVVMKHQYDLIQGKALLYDRRLVIQFFSNQNHKFDSTIFIPLFGKHPKAGDKESKFSWMKAILTSANERDESYTCETLIFKKEAKTKFSETRYEEFNCQDKSQLEELNDRSLGGFKNVGNYLIYRKYNGWRLMERDWKRLVDNNSEEVEKQGHQHFISAEDAFLITVNNLIFHFFTKTSKDEATIYLKKVKAMKPFYDAANSEEAIRKKLKERGLIKDQSEDIIEIWKGHVLGKESIMEVANNQPVCDQIYGI